MKTTLVVLASLLLVACGKRSSVTNEASAIAAVERWLAGKVSDIELRQLRPFHAGITGGSENPGVWIVWSANGKKMFSIARTGEIGEWTMGVSDTLTFSNLPNKAPEPTP